jgi:hypothetical protein
MNGRRTFSWRALHNRDAHRFHVLHPRPTPSQIPSSSPRHIARDSVRVRTFLRVMLFRFARGLWIGNAQLRSVPSTHPSRLLNYHLPDHPKTCIALRVLSTPSRSPGLRLLQSSRSLLKHTKPCPQIATLFNPSKRVSAASFALDAIRQAVSIALKSLRPYQHVLRMVRLAQPVQTTHTLQVLDMKNRLRLMPMLQIAALVRIMRVTHTLQMLDMTTRIQLTYTSQILGMMHMARSMPSMRMLRIANMFAVMRMTQTPQMIRSSPCSATQRPLQLRPIPSIPLRSTLLSISLTLFKLFCPSDFTLCMITAHSIPPLIGA